jgi:hypothetical protein
LPEAIKVLEAEEKWGGVQLILLISFAARVSNYALRSLSNIRK